MHQSDFSATTIVLLSPSVIWAREPLYWSSATADAVIPAVDVWRALQMIANVWSVGIPPPLIPA